MNIFLVSVTLEIIYKTLRLFANPQEFFTNPQVTSYTVGFFTTPKVTSYSVCFQIDYLTTRVYGEDSPRTLVVMV